MMKRIISVGLLLVGLMVGGALELAAQSGVVRPRRVKPAAEMPETPPANNGNATATATPAPTPRPRLTPAPAATPTPPPRQTIAANNTGANTAPAGNSSVVKGDTARAFSLLQQKQYAAALAEAKRVSAQFPNDPEAWKIAGFAQLSLNQPAAAAADLQKANDLLRAAGKEDTFAFDALAQAYFLAEQYGKALPLLTAATNRANPKADNILLYYRGVAEFRAGKAAEAEKTFNEVVKANPKDTGALYFLGQFAYEKSDMTACVNWLNRATVIDPNMTDAWRLLASAYQRRAATETEPARAEADYLGAVRAGEQLSRRSQATEDTLLYAQALIGAKQYAKALPLLDKAALAKPTDGRIFFLLGAAQLRANNMPKAILAFEQAAKLTPNDTNIYRELGYAYEVQKQYAKALAAYQKGAKLAPDDQYFQESVARVKPFAKTS
jgi:tetratricopeptide (TPR) repeat protein